MEIFFCYYVFIKNEWFTHEIPVIRTKFLLLKKQTRLLPLLLPLAISRPLPAPFGERAAAWGHLPHLHTLGRLTRPRLFRRHNGKAPPPRHQPLRRAWRVGLIWHASSEMLDLNAPLARTS
jgi:hypothetical protein